MHLKQIKVAARRLFKSRIRTYICLELARELPFEAWGSLAELEAASVKEAEVAWEKARVNSDFFDNGVLYGMLEAAFVEAVASVFEHYMLNSKVSTERLERLVKSYNLEQLQSWDSMFKGI